MKEFKKFNWPGIFIILLSLFGFTSCAVPAPELFPEDYEYYDEDYDYFDEYGADYYDAHLPEANQDDDWFYDYYEYDEDYEYEEDYEYYDEDFDYEEEPLEDDYEY